MAKCYEINGSNKKAVIKEAVGAVLAQKKVLVLDAEGVFWSLTKITKSFGTKSGYKFIGVKENTKNVKDSWLLEAHDTVIICDCRYVDDYNLTDLKAEVKRDFFAKKLNTYFK